MAPPTDPSDNRQKTPRCPRRILAVHTRGPIYLCIDTWFHPNAPIRKSITPQADDATVLRNGQLQLIPSADIVPGDIVELAGVCVSCSVRHKIT
eukprot:1159745-Pelagomonas_calceolata.AAC.9